MVRVCGGNELPHADKTKFYLLRAFGNTAHEMWDVTDPAKPTRMNVIVSGFRDTHKSFWECDTGIAYLVGGDPSWRARRMTMIYDLSDPAHPVFIRNFGLPGQQPGSTGPAPSDLHGAISTGPKGNRVYFAYGTGRGGVIQIVDRDKLLNGPKDPTDANLKYPRSLAMDLPKGYGAHTAYPLLGDGYGGIRQAKGRQSRGLSGCARRNAGQWLLETRQMVHIFDITDEAHPLGVSTLTVPEASGHFCDRGGRFGAHSTNENLTSIYYKRLIFVSEFNAGVRAVDIRDPLHPAEVGYFIPAVTDKTDKRCVGEGADQKCKVVIQTNNVEVDDRGYIYITDRANTGLHILELTGPARQLADFSQQLSQK